MSRVPVDSKKKIREKIKVVRENQRLVVEVRREAFDGHVYSQVRDTARDYLRYDLDLPPVYIVIDRQKGRGLDSDTVIHRAEALAELMGIPIDIDLTWAAEKGLNCRCPKCVNITRLSR